MKGARTSAEMRFVAKLEACPSCGVHELGTLQILRGDGVIFMKWDCPRCRTARTVAVPVEGNPLLAPVPARFELGEGPSEIISAETFLDELTKAMARVPEDPSTLAPAEWEAGFDAAIYAMTCVTELLKMPSSGSTTKLEADRDRMNAAVERFIADRPRHTIDVTRHAPPDPIGKIDRASLLAHRDWVARGGIGEGRLVLRNQRVAGERYGNIQATSADIADSAFRNVDMSWARLDKTKLTRCVFDGADLAGGTVADAVITGGSWRRARLAALYFTNARVRETDFSESDLERALFWDARVSDAIFDGVRFGNARFDRAVFERCRFRGASFAKILDTPEPTSKGAQFIDCDFTDTDWTGRNVEDTTFVRCEFQGARGRMPSDSRAI